MAVHSKQTVKRIEFDQQEVTVLLTSTSDWKAYVPDHPALAGRTYIGKTESEALMHANADIHTFFKHRAKEVIIRVED